MPIALVDLQTTCARTVFNEIADTVATIMGPTETGYGYQGSVVSTITTSTTLIDLLDWQKLYSEVELINYHILGVPLPTVVGAPPSTLGGTKTTATIRANWVNSIITATNYAVLNQYSVASNQLATLAISDTSNESWDSTIVSKTTTQWADGDSARYFFNLGGRIQPTLSYVSTYPAGYWDNQWKGLINQANSLLAANPYKRSLYIAGSATYSTSTTALSNGDFISIDYNRVNDQEIETMITFYVDTAGIDSDSAIAKNLRITNTVNTYYTNRYLASPKPVSSSILQGLNQGGGSITPTVKTLRASVNNLNFNMRQNDESARQTVTLTNTGNADIEIVGILFSANQNTRGPIPNLYQGWNYQPDTGELTTVQPGTSVSFDITYTSQQLGIYNNFIHILSTCDHGTIAIKTKQNVAGPVFRTSLDTVNVINVTNFHVITDQLNITQTSTVPLRSYTKGVCTLQWGNRDLSDHPEIFTVDDSKIGGPLVTFNPEGFLQFAGTNVAIVTATIRVNCISQSVPGSVTQTTENTAVVTLNINLPESANFGTWLSPTSEDNCVVGMSYDIINLEQYLTIGVGATTNLLNGSGKLTYPLPSQLSGDQLTPNNLGINADPSWDKGVALYKVNKPIWTAGDPVTGFLHSYGVWFTADGYSPSGKLVNRRYTFKAPGDGYYNWQFAADLIGYFSIDGTTIGDTRRANSVIEARTGFSGQIFLKQGTHTIQLSGANLFEPTTTLTGIALNITQSGGASVWSTLTPVRATAGGDTYSGWSEVYRIPLSSIGTGVPQTYYSGGYVVKSTGAVFGQYNWQDFFGNYNKGSAGGGSLFVVDDDGYGNLKIRSQYKTVAAGLASQDQTLEQLQYITYYYNNLDFDSPKGQTYSSHARRIHNLEGPQGNGSVCRQFVGFNSDGVVQTILTKYPGYQGFDPVPRYLRGSLNLGTTSIPDPGVKSWINNLIGNPALWALGVGYGLWTGGIGNFIQEVGKEFGSQLISKAGTWIIDTFIGGGEAGVLVGQILDFGGAIIGELLGTSATSTGLGLVGGEGIASAFAAIGEGVSFLGVLGAAMPYIAAAYLVYAYGGQLVSAVKDVVTGVVNVVSDVIETVGDFIGDAVESVGNFFSDLFSDERLKEDILKITNAVELINQLNGYEFRYKHNKQLSNGPMAQELERVLPEAVGELDHGYKIVQYDRLTGYLIEAVKELSQTVKALEDKIKTLENSSNSLI